MKRYIIKDEEGKVVNVTELGEGEQAPKSEAPKCDEGEGAAAPFTPEQMDAIRKIISEELAKSAGATKPAEGEAHDAEEKAKAEEMKKEEEAKKLEEEKKAADAKKAKDAAAVAETKSVKVADSTVSLEDERDNAWLTRYGLSK